MTCDVNLLDLNGIKYYKGYSSDIQSNLESLSEFLGVTHTFCKDCFVTNCQIMTAQRAKINSKPDLHTQI
jgi:hypothetical protein